MQFRVAIIELIDRKYDAVIIIFVLILYCFGLKLYLKTQPIVIINFSPKIAEI